MSEFDWFDKKMLDKVSATAVVQGGHRQRIVEYCEALVQQARKEFNEDEKPALDYFLKECFEEALKNV